MTTENAGRRPHYATHYTCDAKTPNVTAYMFRQRFYPPETALAHREGRFTFHDENDLHKPYPRRPIAREVLAAQVYDFMRLAVDPKGEMFDPTPRHVSDVLKCLAMATQVIPFARPSL